MKNRKNPLIFVITPAFNNKDHVDQFLRSLNHQNYDNFKIIIIDDGSTDGTAEMIKRKYPKTILLFGNGNLWWSGATNKGVKYALKNNADFILTVNNDVEFSKNYLSQISKTGISNPKSLIGSKILDINNKKKVWYCGAFFNKKTADLEHRTGNDKDYKKLTESEWLTGMGVLIPAQAYRDVGLYDKENFPQYFADSDFSLRAKQKDYRLLVDPNSKIFVDLGSSWLAKQFINPKLSFPVLIFTSIKSQYKVGLRYKYYKKYWPTPWRRALLKFYFLTLQDVYTTYFKALVRKALHIKKRSRK